MKTPAGKNADKHLLEIRVALLGFVSVGKTTVLNALFRDKYGEVSMRRTTAGVNYFAVVGRNPYGTTKASNVDGANQGDKTETTGTTGDLQPESMQWSTTVDKNPPRSAESILNEISKDNKAWRESADIHHKNFSIELENDLVPMRPDTQLVVIDVPGVNEAGTDNKYYDHVESMWKTLDCVVIVMDGRNGVNTEEQVNLFKFVKEQNQEQKDIPVIVLCNKVDDPDDTEQMVLVDEARVEIEKIFEVGDRNKSLQTMLEKKMVDAQSYPVFIPTSAAHAFLFQTGSLLPPLLFKDFANKNREILDKFGREEAGRFKWKKLTEEEKLTTIQEALRDPELYQERLASTNFDKFLEVLVLTIGGSERQLSLIENQLSIAKKVLAPNDNIVEELRLIYAKSKVLGKPTSNLKVSFWDFYDDCENIAFSEFDGSLDVEHLGSAMGLLVSYHAFSQEVGWADEDEATRFAMRALIRRFIVRIINEECYRNVGKKWQISMQKRKKSLTWDTLSPEDWKTICRSILLLKYEAIFCESFGPEIIMLESLLDRIVCSFKMTSCKCSSECSHETQEFRQGFKIEDGLIVPSDHILNATVHQIGVPEKPAHPMHWGHLVWKYCQFEKHCNLQR